MAVLRTLWTGPGLLLVALFPKRNPRLLRRYAFREARNWARALVSYAGVRIHVHGRERIPTEGPVVFMANHQGMFDIPVMAALSPLPIGFMAKESLGRVPIMSRWMRHMGSVFIKRENLRSAAQAAIDCINVLKSGQSMVIFPEGTRSKGSTMQSFKAGSIKIPAKAGVPIVPVTLDGTWRVLEGTKGRVSPAVINVTFHDPVATQGLSNDELDALPEQIRATIQSGFVNFGAIPGYRTPEGIKRLLRHWLLLGSRWAVYSVFADIVLTYRKFAVRGTYTDELWAHSSHDILFRLEESGVRFDIQGLDHIRGFKGPAVFVANHMSTLETLILPGLIAPSKPCTYVVKESLVKGIMWGPIMRSRNPITLSRKDVRADLAKVLEEGAANLAEGRSIIIFPEGTRHDVFKREDFNSLGIKLAAKAGVPVVPVALKTDLWGNGKVLKGFGPVDRNKTVFVEFGTAMAIDGRGKVEHERCLDFIEERLGHWKSLPGQS